MDAFRILLMRSLIEQSPPKTGDPKIDAIIAETWIALQSPNDEDLEREVVARIANRPELGEAARIIMEYLGILTEPPSVPGPFGYGTGGGKHIIRKGTEMT